MGKILVIGNGYLGSYLVKELRARRYDVFTASKNGTDHCLEADLGSLHSVKYLSRSLEAAYFQPDVIVHCASSSQGGPDTYREVFVEGVKNLNSVYPATTKILTGSTSVYTQTDGEVVTEESPANPDRDTGRHLREAEELILENRGIVLRLAGIYGPGRSVHLKKMLQGTASIESGEVSRWLNQIHRDDAAEAIMHLIESENPDHQGQIYNVADDHPISQRECYEKLAEILNQPVPEESPPETERKRAWTHKKVSNEKLKATGWELKFPSFIEAVTSDPRLLESIDS